MNGIRINIQYIFEGNISIFLLLFLCISFNSCSVLERASGHGFNSGYYQLKNDHHKAGQVYADVSEEKIDVYPVTKKQPGSNIILTIPVKAPDSMYNNRVVFTKQSLDIDVTSVLLKYRPSVYGLPAQLNTDFNIALYAGWRFDHYIFLNRKDALGRPFQKMIKRGYDFGIFAGPGATTISPFTTLNRRDYEYSALIIQTGFAGFLETDVASFGVAVGIDYLLNPDRKVWVYQQKPWFGFIIGIALN